MSLSDLRLALNRVLDELAQRHDNDQVELTADYYWVLDARAAYEMTAAPSTEHLTVGQLSDDLQEVAALSAATTRRFRGTTSPT